MDENETKGIIEAIVRLQRITLEVTKLVMEKGVSDGTKLVLESVGLRIVNLSKFVRI